MKQQYTVKVPTMIYIFTSNRFPNNMETRNALDISLRAFKVCSNDQHLKNKIRHFKIVFRDISDYPNWVTEQTTNKVKNQNKMPRLVQAKTSTEENEHLLMVRYNFKVAETRLKSLRNTYHTSE